MTFPQDLIIDADSHVTEAPDTWTARVPAAYRDGVPYVERSADGVDHWMLGGERLTVVGGTAIAGWRDFPKSFPPTYEDCHPGAYLSEARLRYMDEAGIWAQVLYPNVGGFGSERFLKLRDDTLKLVCVSAYNDFLLEWSSADRRRLLPIVATPYWDIDATVREIERCASLGARGILFTGEPGRYGLPVLGAPHWDPLWECAKDTNLPIHFHIGSGGDLTDYTTPERYKHHGVAGYQAHAAVALFMKNGVQCCDLITSGVLNRYPSLKFVSVESGVGWLPFMLEATDYSWLGASQAGRKAEDTSVLPSELFRQSVYVTYWFESVAPRHFLDQLPVDNIMFETDFPHVTCLFGNIQETIESGLGAVDPGVRRKVLWENAARLYGIEEPPVAWRQRRGDPVRS